MFLPFYSEGKDERTVGLQSLTRTVELSEKLNVDSLVVNPVALFLYYLSYLCF
jgi:hypothetical protein